MSTALDLGRNGWRPYLVAEQPPLIYPELTTAKRKERNNLLKRIRQAANKLKKDFGTRKVILFGSLACELWFTADSDVDLAVE